MHFLDRCVEAENVGFLTIWGVSANTRSWWNNSGAERLGYQPTQDAEAYAEEILARPNPLDALGQRFQGGSFVGIDYSRDDAGADGSAASSARSV
jgi:uronate dehydrogenase